jgi:spoIIIJ-associated protein
MDRVEATGRTVNEAIENALVRLGTTRDDVEVEILHEGSRGVLGLGAQDARVVVTRKDAVLAGEDRPAPDAPLRQPSGLEPAPRRPLPTLTEDLPEVEPLDEAEQEGEVAVASDELVDASVSVVHDLLDLMHLDGSVDVRSKTYPLTLNVEGDDLGILIGRHGDTLSSLQFIVNLIVGRRMGRWTRLVVDVEEYRLRRERTLRDIASRAADRVRRTRQTVTLEPMPSNERRIVHLALQGDRFVSTHSIGEGDGRKVVISPRGR